MFFLPRDAILTDCRPIRIPSGMRLSVEIIVILSAFRRNASLGKISYINDGSRPSADRRRLPCHFPCFELLYLTPGEFLKMCKKLR